MLLKENISALNADIIEQSCDAWDSRSEGQDCYLCEQRVHCEVERCHVDYSVVNSNTAEWVGQCPHRDSLLRLASF